MKMSFGKYGPKNFPPNGVSIEFINSGYLKWLLEQDFFITDKSKEPLYLDIQEEMNQRDINNDHFEKDKVKLPERF
jgi:hypothetical protein